MTVNGKTYYASEVFASGGYKGQYGKLDSESEAKHKNLSAPLIPEKLTADI